MRSLLVSLACLLVWCDRGISLSRNMDSKSAINAFSARFAKEVDGAKSTVSSPLSAEIVLGVVALGSSNNSHDEILTSLAFPDDNALRTDLSTAATRLKSVKGVTFSVANKVYVRSQAKLIPDFKSDVEGVFNADVEAINFDESDAAAKTINNWVKGRTNDKITEVIRADDLTPQTELVLLNAIYFKGSWKNKFNPENTKNNTFRIDSSKTKEVPFMEIRRSFNYGMSEELDAKLLDIPYNGDEASMLIILPNEADGLSEVLNKLSSGLNLAEEQQKMLFSEVHVKLPKFKIETEIDLSKLLPKLGVKSIFTHRQLDKMVGGPALQVSKAVQKAFIEVNEEGTEAGAVTSAIASMYSAKPVFEAKHPFLAAVRVGDSFAFWAAVREP